MLVFAISDKGGAGRSVTGANVLYRSALQGNDVCYVDFDFGAPTVGAIFNVSAVERGTTRGGLHSYLLGAVTAPQEVDLWSESDRPGVRERPSGSGRMVLMPGDAGGGEFLATAEVIGRCAGLFLRLQEQFDLCLIDVSAGRSHALEMVLTATALPELRGIRCRWLVFHRWTRQHVVAAADLIYAEHGILDLAHRSGHDPEELAGWLRVVHTAVVDPVSVELAGLTAEQITWLRACDEHLRELSAQLRVGRSLLLGSVPMEPILQWREQLVSDDDVLLRRIASPHVREAFEQLANRIVDDAAWGA